MSHGGVTNYQVVDWDHENTKVDPSTDKMVWTDVSNGCSWINESFAQGVIQPYIISAGTLNTTITATSAVNVFTVASIGDAVVNDLIMFQTDWTTCNGRDYPYAKADITGISGNIITTDAPQCADNSTGAVPGTNRPLVGGWAHEGNQYLGGGPQSTRSYAVLVHLCAVRSQGGGARAEIALDGESDQHLPVTACGSRAAVLRL